MEDGVGRVSRNLLQQLADSLGVCGKINIVDEGSVEVDCIECLESRGILNQRRRPRDGIHEPRLAPDVSSVENSFALALEYFRDGSPGEWAFKPGLASWALTKHDGAGAVVGIEQSDLDLVTRLELEDRRGFQGEGLLNNVDVSVYATSSKRGPPTSSFLRWRYLCTRASKTPLA